MDMGARGPSPFRPEAAGQGAKNPPACGSRPMASEPAASPSCLSGGPQRRDDPAIAPGPEFCGPHRLRAGPGADAALLVAFIYPRAPLRLSFRELPECGHRSLWGIWKFAEGRRAGDGDREQHDFANGFRSWSYIVSGILSRPDLVCSDGRPARLCCECLRRCDFRR